VLSGDQRGVHLTKQGKTHDMRSTKHYAGHPYTSEHERDSFAE